MVNNITDIQKRINSSTGVFRGSNGLNNQSFQMQIDNIIVNTNEKMLAVMRDSLNETVEDMQTPRSRGGRMRIDTGFLRSSGVAALNAIPSGPSKVNKNLKYNWPGENLVLTLAKMNIGDVFFWGWTANYAKYREAYDGFMEASLQNWQGHVNNSISKIKQKFK